MVSFSDHRRPFQHHVRIEHRIFSNGDPGIDPCGGRIDHPYPGIEPAMTDLPPHDLFGFGQLAPCVDAKAFVRILEPNRRHSASLLDRHLHDVRQVKFSLRIARLQSFEGGKQKVAFNDVGTDIDLMDHFDRGVGVTIFHDA
jgi:hypothetical protein